jgi:hypothetical protein
MATNLPAQPEQPGVFGRPIRGAQPWANLYELRNHLAHHRLPDVGDGRVRRITWLSTDQLRTQVQQLLRTTG